MYKGNRRDGSVKGENVYVSVSIDVSKNTLDLCLLRVGVKGQGQNPQA